MDIEQYKEAKVNQLQHLLYYMPFCETSSQKYKIEDEIKQIKFLIDNAEDVYLLNAEIESKVNYIKIEEHAEILE